VAETSACRRLRPGDTAIYIKPRTITTRFGERGFWFASPDAWNSLLPHLHRINDTAVLT